MPNPLFIIFLLSEKCKSCQIPVLTGVQVLTCTIVPCRKIEKRLFFTWDRAFIHRITDKFMFFSFLISLGVFSLLFSFAERMIFAPKNCEILDDLPQRILPSVFPIWNFVTCSDTIGNQIPPISDPEAPFMHELSITQSILDISLQAAGRAACRTDQGDSGFSSGSSAVWCRNAYRCIWTCWPRAPLPRAPKIEVIEVPLRVECLDCGRESDIDRRHIECPFCKSIRLKRLSGREFLVDSLEVDT